MSTDIASERVQHCFTTLLRPENGYVEEGSWLAANPLPYVCGWKLHIWGNSLQDWATLVQSITPYLSHYKVSHKTGCTITALESLLSPSSQQGKLFTIYTVSLDDIKQVAFDLDHYFLINNLSVPYQPRIYGDRSLGQSGRLFYRYGQDLEGNYRANDGQPCPMGMIDLMELLAVETRIITLPLNTSFQLTAHTLSPYLSQASPFEKLHLLITRTDTGWLVSPQVQTSDVQLNTIPLTQPTMARIGDRLQLNRYWGLLFLNPDRLSQVP